MCAQTGKFICKWSLVWTKRLKLEESDSNKPRALISHLVAWGRLLSGSVRHKAGGGEKVICRDVKEWEAPPHLPPAGDVPGSLLNPSLAAAAHHTTQWHDMAGTQVSIAPGLVHSWGKKILSEMSLVEVYSMEKLVSFYKCFSTLSIIRVKAQKSSLIRVTCS